MIALVLRPEPGASATCRRAAAIGCPPVSAPLFALRPVAWEMPGGDHDAVMVTSASALLLGGAKLGTLLDRPLYAVGAATAAAARDAGFADVRAGSDDAAALVAMAAADGVRRLLHLAARERRAVGHPAVAITAVTVYAAEAETMLSPAAHAALAGQAVALLHSPRAAALFADLADAAGIARAHVRIAAISAAALAAAGRGWRASAAADRPTDAALLDAAMRIGV